MRNRVFQIGCLVTLVWIAASTGLHAQTASATATAVQQTPFTPAVLMPVPRVIWFNGTFRPANKRPVASVETVTVAVYREREGGDAVWQETQIVAMEADGRYSLLMGSTLSDGMPLDVFTSGEPRWIGITVHRPGEAEQPRVHLASVPYALKAADTETLGGKPASAYLLAEQKTPHASRQSADAASPLTAGTPGYLGMFVDSANLGNSALYQNGAAIGLGTPIPRDSFHVTFTDGGGGFTGYAVQNLSSAVNAYSGMLFYDQTGATAQFQGFNNSTHEYRINNVATGGTINFMIGSTSKLLVANSGNIGVGVPAPASKLDVAGDINLTGTLKMTGGTVLRETPNFRSIGLGVAALDGPTLGDYNTAAGYHALSGLDSPGATRNTAFGAYGLELITTGNENTSVGFLALADNTTGEANTAVGAGALTFNDTGSNNIAVGFLAGINVGTGQNNNIHIGSEGIVDDSETIRLGAPGFQLRFFAAGVRDATTGFDDAVPVVIDSDGQLGTISSSRRFKDDIHDMGDASRGLMRLRPVTFRYKTPFSDGSKPIQYGLIAEEVAEVYPHLVAHSSDGQIQTVKYQVLGAMLLNEVQQLHAQMRAVIQQNQDLQQRLAALEAALSGRR